MQLFIIATIVRKLNLFVIIFTLLLIFARLIANIANVVAIKFKIVNFATISTKSSSIIVQIL